MVVAFPGTGSFLPAPSEPGLLGGQQVLTQSNPINLSSCVVNSSDNSAGYQSVVFIISYIFYYVFNHITHRGTDNLKLH